MIDAIAANPEAGDIIAGTGGFRKLRFRRANTGKSGGVRVIYFYHAANRPISLAMIYAKSASENITDAQKNILFELAKQMKKGGY